MPPSIDPTGLVDVTAALQRFLSAAPDGSVVELRRGARYRVDGTLRLTGRHGLTILGAGATVLATTMGGRDRSQWWVTDGSRIVFRDLRVRGANPNGGTAEGAYVRRLETQHGFHLEGVNGVELDHVTVSDVYGDCVYVGRDPHRRPSRNVWIHDSTCTRDGRQGIAVTDANNVVIERNHLYDLRRSTIDLEPTGHSWRVTNVFVLRNDVGHGRLLFVASHGQGTVSRVVVSNNQLHGHALTIDVASPKRRRRADWVVVGNTSDTSVRTRAMRFRGIDGLLLRGNTQPVEGDGAAAVLSAVCGARIGGNDFGSAPVTERGASCPAPLVVPQVQPIPGRVPTPVTTPPTTPVTPAPTTQPAAPGGGGGRGHPWSSGVIAALVALVVLAALLGGALAVRRRRAGPAGRDEDV